MRRSRWTSPLREAIPEAPLVDESGNVMGINVATAYDLTTGQLSDVHYAIVIDELTKILDSERIAYTMAGGGLSWTQPWFAYVFLPLGILALAGGVVLLVLTVRKGGAVLAAAGPGSGKAPVRGGQKRPALRGVTGKYSGQSFDLSRGKVVIGRDPAACNIVFDKNTPGISGRHCQVVYEPNEDCFVITDLGFVLRHVFGQRQKADSQCGGEIVCRGHLLPVRQCQPVRGDQGVTLYGRVLPERRKGPGSMGGGRRRPGAGGSLPPDCPGRDEAAGAVAGACGR